MKIQVPAHPISGALAYELDPLDLADRLDDIASRLGLAILAVRGANTVCADDLGPIADLLEEASERVKAVSADIHPGPSDDDEAGGEDESAEV